MDVGSSLIIKPELDPGWIGSTGLTLGHFCLKENLGGVNVAVYGGVCLEAVILSRLVLKAEAHHKKLLQ